MCDNMCCNTVLVYCSYILEVATKVLEQIKSQNITNRHAIITRHIKSAREFDEKKFSVRLGLQKKKGDEYWDNYRKETFEDLNAFDTRNDYKDTQTLCNDLIVWANAADPLSTITIAVSDFALLERWAKANTAIPNQRMVDLYFI